MQDRPARQASREQKYMERRWGQQYSFYSAAARHNKKMHERLSLFVVIGSATIPVLINLNIPNIPANPAESIPVPSIIPTLISLLVAIAAGIETTKKYGDNWRNYRQTLEAMRRERALYDTKTGDYAHSADPFSLFVERAEMIMGEETTRFVRIHTPDKRSQPSARI